MRDNQRKWSRRTRREIYFLWVIRRSGSHGSWKNPEQQFTALWVAREPNKKHLKKDILCNSKEDFQAKIEYLKISKGTLTIHTFEQETNKGRLDTYVKKLRTNIPTPTHLTKVGAQGIIEYRSMWTIYCNNLLQPMSKVFRQRPCHRTSPVMPYLHPVCWFSAFSHENSSITLWRIAEKNHIETSLYLEARFLVERLMG